MTAVSTLCVGKTRCEIPTDRPELFGGSPCKGTPADWRLVVKTVCGANSTVTGRTDSDKLQRPNLHVADSNASSPQAVRGVVNGDAEAYPVAGLGCSMGIMRGQTAVLRPPPDQDQQTGWDLNGTNRHIKFRVDEASRATRWQRLGPPFGIHELRGDVVSIDGVLVDSWAFRSGETWYKSDVSTHPKQQAAPARIARGGIALPEVTAVDATGEPSLLPFVTACRYPTEVASVTTLGRVLPYPHGYSLPRANVSMIVDWLANGSLPLIGVFGRYDTLTIAFKQFSNTTWMASTQRAGDASSNTIVLAQDLLSNGPPTDISHRVLIEEHVWGGASLRVGIPGAVIDEVGTSGRSNTKDVSDPGLVLMVTRPSSTAI
eukprot:COSAG02_NODE_2561_length_8528_cov_8.976391_5_plen_374_part_00